MLWREEPLSRCARLGIDESVVAGVFSELNTQQREARPNGVGGIFLRTDARHPGGTRDAGTVPGYPHSHYTTTHLAIYQRVLGKYTLGTHATDQRRPQLDCQKPSELFLQESYSKFSQDGALETKHGGAASTPAVCDRARCALPLRMCSHATFLAGRSECSLASGRGRRRAAEHPGSYHLRACR